MNVPVFKIDETRSDYRIRFADPQQSSPIKVRVYNISASVTKPTKAIFKECADKWKNDTAHLSIISQRLQHPAYQRIIRMGPSIVPFILEEMEQQPNHWFYALSLLTDANPIPADFKGTVRDAADLWIRWGKSRYAS